MQNKDLTLNLYGQVESIHTEQYTTNKGHRYDVVKVRINVNGASLELTAREKVIKLTKERFLYLFVTQSDQNGRFAISFVTC